MENAKKMILISPDAINRIYNSHSNNPHQIEKEEIIISKLDRDMKEVLESSTDDYNKWKMYEQVLQRYLHFANDLRKPIEIPILNNNVENETNDALEIAEIVRMVPKSFRQKATMLLEYLDKNKKTGFSWDRKGIVHVGEKVIANLNIVDLVNDVLRSRKYASSPTGWTEFVNVLKYLNVPLELIGNVDRKRYIQKPRSESGSDAEVVKSVAYKTTKTKNNSDSTILSDDLRKGWKKLKF